MNWVNQGKTMIGAIRTFLRNISHLALLVMMLLIVISSLGRYLLGTTIPGVLDIVRLILLPTVIWMYAPEVQLTESNITMDLVSNRLSDSVNRGIKLLFYPLVVFLLFVAFEDLLHSTIDLWNDQVWTTGSVAIPAYATRGLITLGVLMLLLTISAQIVLWLCELRWKSTLNQYVVNRGQSND